MRCSPARGQNCRYAPSKHSPGIATVVPLGLPAVRLSAAFRRYLERRREGIGAMDPLIAGTAIQADGAWSRVNRRHFDRVPGLRVLDP